MKPDGKESIPCYVGRAACGCMVSAIVDDPEQRDRMANDIKEFLRDCIDQGLTVGRTTVGDVRQHFGCNCNKAEANQKALFA